MIVHYPEEIQKELLELEKRYAAQLGTPVRLLLVLRPDEPYIRQMVCQEYGVSWDEISSTIRRLPVVLARQAYVYLLYRYLSFSKAEIARILNMHHTSIIHSLDTTINALQVGDMSVDKLKALIVRIEMMIKYGHS